MEFFKVQATGNDFVIFDFFNNKPQNLSKEFIRKICNRHFGVGADGVLLILKDKEFDFRMKFYNPDGSVATFCGNGGRAITLLANHLGIIPEKAVFIADDGIHFAQVLDKNTVKLQMQNIENHKFIEGYLYLNTGTHHVVIPVKNIHSADVNTEGRKIRYLPAFQPHGTNVNFFQPFSDHIFVRTYEKGVEQETLSCGTGVVAAAIGYTILYNINSEEVNVKTHGGNLSVSFEKQGNTFKNVFLTGETQIVFKGKLLF